MGLRTRLWLVVGALVVFPLALVGVTAVLLLGRDGAAKTTDRLNTAARGSGMLIYDACAELSTLAGATALDLAARGSEHAFAFAGTDAYVAFVGPGAAQRDNGVARPPGTLATSRCERLATPVMAARAPVTDSSAVAPEWVIVARELDGPWLAGVKEDLGLQDDLVVAADGRALATTRASVSPRLVADAEAHPGVLVTRDGSSALSQPVAARASLHVIAVSRVSGVGHVTGFLSGLGLVLVLLALGVGWLVARGMTRPLADLTAASERVAAGDLTTAITVRSDDEVGRLGRSFNRMTAEMRHYLDALERSRDELRDNLERLGEALGSTHDLDALVLVVLESAIAAAGAGAGAAYIAEAAGPLSLLAAQGTEDIGFEVSRRVMPGVGVLGAVAATGEVIRGALGVWPGQVRPGSDVPTSGPLLAVPLRGGGRVTGVLALFAREGEPEFTQEQEHEIRALAGQAGVAVENILLHKEAQRLAITDPLTGLWNFRYLSMSLAREIERANRFERPLAVLMLDIDFFKSVNDNHGHPRGDAVLREFASRVGEQIREVDILARYGGEEFVLVLPETTVEGAVQLAERVRVGTSRTPFRGGAGEAPLVVTVSIGVAAFPDHGGSPATLLRSADSALYAAKRAGRDRCAVAELGSATRPPGITGPIAPLGLTAQPSRPADA